MNTAFNYLSIAPVEPVPASGNERTSVASAAPGARFDVCPTWLELAIRHLSDARTAQAARVSDWRRDDDTAELGALEWEFEASLQAVVACGIALQSFAAMVQSKVQLPASLHDEWRINATPRHVQISEVLRRAFALSSRNASGVRQCVGEVLRFHDLAVDPSNKTDSNVFHPELKTAVAWRFVYFRYENALLIVQATFRLIWELVDLGQPYESEVQKYVEALRSKVEPLRNSDALRARRL